MVIANNNNDSLQIVLTPNRSATWQFNCTVLKLFGIVVFGIAIGWSLMGVWIVLPFAGIEFALLVYFVYRTSHDCYRKEVLHLEDNRIRFERGRRFPTAQIEFDRNACEFIKQNPNHVWSAAAIKLRCRGKYTRIGRFLNRDDVDQLWRMLSSSGVKYREEGKVSIKDTNIFGL